MANVLVLGVKVPFTSGGQEILVRDLVREINATGVHKADLIELPFQVWPKEQLLNQGAAWRILDFAKICAEQCDLVIATKFPTYFATHAKKSIWLVHQHRALYDLYGSRYADFSDDPRDTQLREQLVSADTNCLAEADYVSAISTNVAERLQTYNALRAEVLYPPLPQGDKYYYAPAEEYVLSVGRLCGIKRIDLMIKALPQIHKNLRLKIVGTPDESSIMEYYQNEIAKHHLADRIDFLGRVSNEELLELYAKSKFVYYAPHNEDYGYVTLEAMASGKAVVTAADSGGVLEFIEHETNGLIIDRPETDLLAKACNRLVEDADLAEKLGENGLAWIADSGLRDSGWKEIVQKLLSPVSGQKT